MSDFIQCVNGAIPAADVEMILPHEHFFIDLSNQANHAESRPVTPADRMKLMHDPYCMTDNLLLDDLDAAVAECNELAAMNCNLVVDCSNSCCGQDGEKLQALSQAGNINIVAGCGLYTADTHPGWVKDAPVEEITEFLMQEITCGIAPNGCRPGIIGEIGTSKTVLPAERKALQAAFRACKATNLAVMVHIYPWADNGLEVLETMRDNQVAPDRVVICHSDVTPDKDYIWEVLKQGAFIEFDNFGKEFTCEPGGFADGSFIKDTQRVKLAAGILKSSYASQLLITNDICLKCMLRSRGGEGYTHILRNIVPMLAQEGFDIEEIKQRLLHDNPLRMLCGRL